MNMKKIIACVFSLLIFMGASAQDHDISVDPTAPYLKDKRIPAFVLNTIDGREITNKQLPTNYKYIALIF